MIAVAMVLACLVSGMTATAIRSVTGRTRPSAAVPQGWYGVRNGSHWLVGDHDFNSFPSGHVGAAVGFIVPLVLFASRGRIVAILLCGLLAWARMFAGAHHLSDVMVASIIGIAGGYYVSKWVLPRYVEPFLTERSVLMRKPLLVGFVGSREANSLPVIDEASGTADLTSAL